MDKPKDKLISDLEKEVERLERRVRGLGQKNAGLAEGTEELQKERVRLQKERDRLQKERDRLQKERDRLQKENEQLRKENQDLRCKTRKGHRQAGRFSRDKKKSNPKRPGRKAGHQGASRPVPPEVDETVPVPLCGCPFCGGEVFDREIEDLFQTDIPETPKPRRTKFQVGTGWCPFCEKRVRARDPRQAADPSSVAPSVLGPNVLALLALLKDGYGMPFRKISDFLERFFGMKVTPGGISQALDRVADRLAGSYDILVHEVRRSAIIHVDETGWRINGDTAWLWVFTNDKVTVYTIRRSRGSDVLVDMLSEDFQGWLVSDCLNTYRSFGGKQGKCLSHLIKDLADLERQKVGRAKVFSRRALLVCRDAIGLKSSKADLPEDVYEAATQDILNRLLELIEGRYSDPDNNRLARRIETYLTEFFVFLDVDGLDPTNNHAERQLRSAVITRKISCGSRSDNGARRHSIIASIFATAKQHGLDFCSLVVQAILSLGEPVIDRAAFDPG